MSRIFVYDSYIFSSIALLGTIIAAVGLLWFFRHPRVQAAVQSRNGVEPPLIGVLGMLFGLALAFLANDTWSAYDHAIAAVNRESDALHGIVVLAGLLPPSQGSEVRVAARNYAAAAVDEWPKIAHRQTSPAAILAQDHLLEVFADRKIANAGMPEISRSGMEMVLALREGRGTRVSLSQTHINPLKWAVMAFLGFVTILTIAFVHVAVPRAMVVSVGLFALASAPTAAIVLVHGNPFLQPLAVSAAPLEAVLGSLNENKAPIEPQISRPYLSLLFRGGGRGGVPHPHSPT